MGEAKRRAGFKVQQKQVGPHGAIAFLQAFMEAPAGEDVSVSLASTEDEPDQMFIVPQIGVRRWAFQSREARHLAQACEDVMRKYPADPASRYLPDLIMALRASADRVDADRTAPARAPGVQGGGDG